MVVVVVSLAMTCGCAEGSCGKGSWIGEKSWGDVDGGVCG